MAGIFICYRSIDAQGFAGRLSDDLSERFGDEGVFRDDELVPGHPYDRAIESRLVEADAMLVVIGPNWIDDGDHRLQDPSDWVRREIEFAIARGIFTVPVLVGGAELPSIDKLPHTLQPLIRHQAIALDDDSWREDIERLVRVLTSEVPALARRMSTARREDSSTDGQPSPASRLPTSRHAQHPPRPHWIWVTLGRCIKSLLGLAVLALIGYFLLTEYGGAEGREFLSRLQRFLITLWSQLIG